jgi:hypothetical protein
MKKQILTAACALCLSVGVAVAQVHITIGPPPRPHEVVPPPPREHRDWVWHPGYHRWDGRAYVWVPGEYVAPPHPHARWVSGHWDRRHGEWIWVEGHWR